MEADFTFASAYIVAHLGIYLILFRRLPTSDQERTIFLVHAGSFLLLSLTMFAWLVSGMPGSTLAGVVAGLALHGMYSLSFLELWALAKTGFSLRILATVQLDGLRTTSEIVAAHMATSDEKKRARIRSLLARQLIQEKDGSYSLTARGRIAAAILGAVSTAAGNQETG